MAGAFAMEERIVELESKLAFQESTIQELNDIVAKQETLIEKLQRDLQHLQEHVKSITPSNIASEEEETPPPHY